MESFWTLYICPFHVCSKKHDLIDILETIAANSVKANGFFHSGPELECSKMHRPLK